MIAEDVALRRGEAVVNCEDRVQVGGTGIDQIAQLNGEGQVFAGIQGVHCLLQFAERLAVLALSCGRLVAILNVGEYGEGETGRRRLASRQQRRQQQKWQSLHAQSLTEPQCRMTE